LFEPTPGKGDLVKIGIGLPNTTPGATGELMVEWSRVAEERGFSCLATIDRIAYPNFDSLVSLAAAGAVTERIGLFTNVLLAPTRSTALLAKEAVSVDQISRGRLTLGLGVGTRPDDYELAGMEFHDRGKRFEQQIADLKSVFDGSPLPGFEGHVAPEPARPGGPPLIMGGMSDIALRRTVEHCAGWTAGGAPPEAVLPFAQRVRDAWKEAGRDGEPYIYALSYFGLGDDHVDVSKDSILSYYAYFGGGEVGFAESIPRTADAIREAQRKYEDAGVDEVVWDPTVPDIDQVEMLADAAL
jgi:alkanesulfonate monooxygenase SsuD/methylene tetrahydromethanopterin reductase-like flavin-dependent oxidoreductase (luciferase family)